MWYLKACRACLTTTGILIKISPQAKQTFCAITGLQLSEDDGFPQFFCAECIVHIKKAIQFRRRSKRAHFVLKEIHSIKKQVSQTDIEIIDRSKTNLIYPYSYCKPENVAAFSYTTPDTTDQLEEDVTPEIQEAIKESLDINNEPEFKIHCEAVTRTIKIELKKYEVNIPNQKGDEVNNSLVNQEVNHETPSNGLIKQELNILNSTSILVDIKPSNWRELEEKEEEMRKRERQAEIDAALKEIKEDDGHFDEGLSNDYVIPEDIDMEDIFKGLKERSEDSSSDSEPAPRPKRKGPRSKKIAEIIKKRKAREEALKNRSLVLTRKPTLYDYILQNFTKKGSVQNLENAFSAIEIKFLSEQQQKDMYNKLLLTEPFKSMVHKCIVCMVAFSCLNELYAHFQFHNDKIIYPHMCIICKDRFDTEEELNQHGAFSHWYEYSCGRCKDKHSTLKSLLKCFEPVQPRLVNNWPDAETHFEIRTLKPEEACEWTGVNVGFSCEECKIYFPTYKKKNSHHQHRHSVGCEFACEFCSRNFKTAIRLNQHMDAWHRYSYTCKSCKVHFRNSVQAKDHQLTEHSMTCQICNEDFALQFEFDEHVSRAHRAWCNMCGHAANGDVKLKIHQIVSHGYIRLNTEAELNDIQCYCEQCEIYFTDQKPFFKHLALMQHDAANNYENGCVGCAQLFDSAEEYQEHNLSCNMTYPKKCEYCPSILQNLVEEQSHESKCLKKQQLKHSRTTHLCETCGKKVRQLSHHVRTHQTQEVMKISCRYCPIKQATPAQHVSHILFTHTDRPYCCSLCGARFLTRTSCRDHILKCHAPVLPYSCEACARRFAHLDYLHDHCVKVHNVDLKKTDKSVFLGKRMFGKVYTYPHMKIDGSLIDLQILEKTPVEICDYMEENNKLIEYTEAFFFDPTVDPTQPTRVGHKKKPPSAEVMKKIYQKRKTYISLRNKEKRRLRSLQKLINKRKNQQENEPVMHDSFGAIQDDSIDIHIDENSTIDENLTNEIDDKNQAIYNKPVMIDIQDDSIDINIDKKEIDDENQEIYNKTMMYVIQDDSIHINIDEDSTIGINDENQALSCELENQASRSNVENMEVDTEDVLGELIEKDGEYFVLVNGVLYTLEDDCVERKEQ